jgi:ABC-2 type transport system permease protein
VGAVAARELRSLFLSPLAWTVLAVVQGILGYLFLLQIDLFMQVQPRLAAVPGAPGLTAVVVTPVLQSAGVVLLLVVPLLTMRLLAEERRSGTLTLLLSAPVSMTQIVLGKYLAIVAFFACTLALTTLMVLTLLLGGTLDFGLLAAGLLGLALLVASFAAAGLFLSSLTTQPVIAAVSTFGLLLLLWLLDWAAGTGSGRVADALSYLSLLTHYGALLKGVFDSKDVAYYLLFSATFVALSIRRLDSDRLQR